MTFDGYLDELKERARRAKGNPDLQHTRHQQDAIETAKALGDKMYGPYLRLFKRYPREQLMACRDWCLRKGKGDNKGRLFMATYRKFLGK